VEHTGNNMKHGSPIDVGITFIVVVGGFTATLVIAINIIPYI